MVTVIDINDSGYATEVLNAIADADVPVRFSSSGDDLQIEGTRDDLMYLLRSLSRFGVPSWLRRALTDRATINGNVITFVKIKLRLTWTHRR